MWADLGRVGQIRRVWSLDVCDVSLMVYSIGPHWYWRMDRIILPVRMPDSVRTASDAMAFALSAAIKRSANDAASYLECAAHSESIAVELMRMQGDVQSWEVSDE